MKDRTCSITPNEYQKKAFRTAGKEPSIVNGALGLTGESGEVADMIKKHIFQGHKLNNAHLQEELGDVMWYIALIASSINTDLETIMQMNIEKLMKRYPDGFDTKRSVNREV